jgi:hypothetical protein
MSDTTQQIYIPISIMTRAQQIALSQSLDIPLATGYTLTDGLGTVRSAMTINPSALIWQEIVIFFTGGTTPAGIVYEAMDAGTLAILKTYLDRWLVLGSKTVEMIGGAVDGVTQISMKPSEERRLLSQWIHNLVPFFTKYEFLKKEAGDKASVQGQAGTGGQKPGVFVPVTR